MENLTAEVGQKMRSAVKAKLIELGTGGSAGYIDDELPDYVMIMVANKRSKQQMIGDLNLFLGTQTDLFVSWLHEVLQKLQEVTLPITAAQKMKRKASETTDITVATKKEKKDKKKDKKLKRTFSNKPDETEPASSISDVFADHLLQKAKQNFQIEASASTKEKQENSPINSATATDDFDIPTISEISHQGLDPTRQKELSELADLQRKIEQAKRQMKSAETESEDDDFLDIKEDAEEFDEDVTDKSNKKHKQKYSVDLDSNKNGDAENNNKEDMLHEQDKTKKRVPITFNEDEALQDTQQSPQQHVAKKRSIHDRLGFKVQKPTENLISLSTHRRVEKEIYMPAFRRKEMEKEREMYREKIDRNDRDRERDRDRDRSEKRRERTKDSESDSMNIRNRIGSRVIVAPPKPEYDENEEDDNMERPVNSVIKIKPRPSVSPSKQASKNLLLRAVAEAQKSTALIRPKKDLTTRSTSPNNASRTQKLYTKSYRNRNREAIIKRVTKDNIIIEVNAEKRPSKRNDKGEDEYVPEPISDRGDSDNDYVYVPRAIHSANSEDDAEGLDNDPKYHHKRTQFVVTLDDKSREKFVTKHKIRVVEKNLNGIEYKRLEINNEVVPNTISTSSSSKLALGSGNVTTNEKKSSSHNKKVLSTKNSETSQNYRKPKEVKKLIIKNDSEDDDHLNKDNNGVEKKSSEKCEEERSTTPPLPPKSSTKSAQKRKRSTVSPIKFDLEDNNNKKRSRDNYIEAASKRSKSDEREFTKDDDDDHHHNSKYDDKHKVSTKKSDSTKKYDNIPALLSSVPVDSSSVKTKSKDRCKYFPSCGKGDSCEFFHPSTPCKAFPSCKFADKCLYLHPKCKFENTCNRIGCNFSHSSLLTPTAAPPLSSHVVPVQNYKSISATPLPAMCKFYPNCTNTVCTFYHPKLCRFGKNCMNKVECNFYHHDLPAKDKFKWVASFG